MNATDQINATEHATEISDAMATLLGAIVTDEYHDGREPIGNPVWTAGLQHGFSKQKVGGLFRAAIKAGLAGTTQDGNDSTCWITAKGKLALDAHRTDAAEVEAAADAIIAAASTKFNSDDMTLGQIAACMDAGATDNIGLTNARRDEVLAAYAKANAQPEPILATGETAAEFADAHRETDALMDGTAASIAADDAARDEALRRSAGLDAAVADEPTPHEARVIRAAVALGSGPYLAVFLDQLDLGAIGGTWAMLSTAIDNLAAMGWVDRHGTPTSPMLRVIATPAQVGACLAMADAAPVTAKPRAARVNAASTAYAVGTVLSREFKGATVAATIRADGVQVGDTMHASLAAAIRSIVGYPCQGFFRSAGTTVNLPVVNA